MLASPQTRFNIRDVAFEAIAYVAPVLFFTLLLYLRINVFIDTHNIVALLNAVGLVFLAGFLAFPNRAQVRDTSWRSLVDSLAGNFLPYFFLLGTPSHFAGHTPEVIETIMVVFAIWTVLSLRRSISVTPDNRGVKTGGPYRIMRHPLYFAVITTQAGLLMEFPHAWNFLVFALTIAFKVRMIINEERVLASDPAYQAYGARVKWRLLPGVF